MNRTCHSIDGDLLEVTFTINFKGLFRHLRMFSDNFFGKKIQRLKQNFWQKIHLNKSQCVSFLIITCFLNFKVYLVISLNIRPYHVTRTPAVQYTDGDT